MTAGPPLRHGSTRAAVTGEPTGGRPRWGLAAPLLALPAGILGAAVGFAVASALTGADGDEVTLANTVGSLVGMWVVYAGIIVATVRARGSGNVATDTGLRAQPIDLAVGTAAGLLTSIVLVRLVYLVLEVVSLVDQSDLDELGDPAEDLTDVANGPGFVLLALFIGLGAPVVEEVFFRGFLQSAAVRRFGTVVGIGATAVIFGAVHFQLLQFPALAVFGGVLGVLAHRYGRLGPAIVAHVAFNSLTLVSLAAG
ncbi:MAG TPA: CPBP family intramembrane glutamic endopeptidase [Acidimicrobiales bacterium]|nr:CPBP family intramembrane glutamic endopeptidase [Acidimicrobiales bacterium]